MPRPPPITSSPSCSYLDIVRSKTSPTQGRCRQPTPSAAPWPTSSTRSSRRWATRASSVTLIISSWSTVNLFHRAADVRRGGRGSSSAKMTPSAPAGGAQGVTPGSAQLPPVSATRDRRMCFRLRCGLTALTRRRRRISRPECPSSWLCPRGSPRCRSRERPDERQRPEPPGVRRPR